MLLFSLQAHFHTRLRLISFPFVNHCSTVITLWKYNELQWVFVLTFCEKYVIFSKLQKSDSLVQNCRHWLSLRCSNGFVSITERRGDQPYECLTISTNETEIRESILASNKSHLIIFKAAVSPLISSGLCRLVFSIFHQGFEFAQAHEDKSCSSVNF